MKNISELAVDAEEKIDTPEAELQPEIVEDNERTKSRRVESSPEDTEQKIDDLLKDLHSAENVVGKSEPISQEVKVIESTASREGHYDKVVCTGEYPISLEELWSRAQNPVQFAEDTPNLSFYEVNKINPDGSIGEAILPNEPIQEGYHIVEKHTFGGFPQRYEGTIKKVVPMKKWSMYTEAVGLSGKLFSLPHFVEYSFEGDETKSRMTIRAHFQSKGLLSLVRKSALNKMQVAIEGLLHVPMKEEAK